MGLIRSWWFPAAVLALATLAPTAQAADPIRWRTDYATARKESAESKRPLLIVVGTTDCLYCLKMEAGTFAEVETAKLISERFIPVKLDATRDAEFVRGMRITLYPTAVIAGSDGKVYAFLAGYLDATAFREHANKALALMPVVKEVVAVVKPVAPSPVASVPNAVERLTAVKSAFESERFGEALERCEALMAGYPNTPESREAALYAARIKADADRLVAATQDLDEKTASAYLSLAEAWVKQGKPKEAAVCYAKAARAAPHGKAAEIAQSRLTTLTKEKE